MVSAALERHPTTPCAALRGIIVSIEQETDVLRVAYILEGEIDRLRIPSPRAPRIADRLWQHTCCELFVACEAAPGYTEFNFSPSGEWAAYAFERYREGGARVDVRPEIAVRQAAGRLELSASIPRAQGKLRAGLSAVIEDEKGALSYWALRHPAAAPDFHHPQAFAIEL